jgi:flagellar motor switch protein FliN
MSSAFNEREFVEGWGEEFAHAVEMFTGSKPTIACAPGAGAPNLAEMKNYLWWKQGYDGIGSGFLTWIGAPEPVWSALGATVGSSSAGPKQIYLELLVQAGESAATRLAEQSGKSVRPTAGQAEERCTSVVSSFWEVKIDLAGAELAPLVYLVDLSKGERNLNSSGEERGSELAIVGDEYSYGSRVTQLLDLDLPMSVILGYRAMQIQDVLKLTSGSVVELDSNIGDPVQIMVHGKLVAKGEVVSVKGNYGVRITEVISRQERLGLEGVLSGPKPA